MTAYYNRVHANFGFGKKSILPSFRTEIKESEMMIEIG